MNINKGLTISSEGKEVNVHFVDGGKVFYGVYSGEGLPDRLLQTTVENFDNMTMELFNAGKGAIFSLIRYELLYEEVK